MRTAFARDYLADADIVASPEPGLPDAADEQVAGAARAAAATIVTLKLAHFPATAPDQHGLKAISPDEAPTRLADEDPDLVLQSVRDIRRRLRNPPLSPSGYADGFEAAGCPGFASWLRQHMDNF